MFLIISLILFAFSCVYLTFSAALRVIKAKLKKEAITINVRSFKFFKLCGVTIYFEKYGLTLSADFVRTNCFSIFIDRLEMQYKKRTRKDPKIFVILKSRICTVNLTTLKLEIVSGLFNDYNFKLTSIICKNNFLKFNVCSLKSISIIDLEISENDRKIIIKKCLLATKGIFIIGNLLNFKKSLEVCLSDCYLKLNGHDLKSYEINVNFSLTEICLKSEKIFFDGFNFSGVKIIAYGDILRFETKKINLISFATSNIFGNGLETGAIAFNINDSSACLENKQFTYKGYRIKLGKITFEGDLFSFDASKLKLIALTDIEVSGNQLNTGKLSFDIHPSKICISKKQFIYKGHLIEIGNFTLLGDLFSLNPKMFDSVIFSELNVEGSILKIRKNSFQIFPRQASISNLSGTYNNWNFEIDEFDMIGDIFSFDALQLKLNIKSLSSSNESIKIKSSHCQITPSQVNNFFIELKNAYISSLSSNTFDSLNISIFKHHNRSEWDYQVHDKMWIALKVVKDAFLSRFGFLSPQLE